MAEKVYHPKWGTDPFSRYEEEDRGYETPCWIWQGARVRPRVEYGNWPSVKDGGTRVAHRRFYERFVGQIPRGLVLHHRCEIGLCVRPEHLEVVSQAVNVRKGKLAKLSDEVVEEIRLRFSGKRGEQKALAEEFGIANTTVSQILSGKLRGTPQDYIPCSSGKGRGRLDEDKAREIRRLYADGARATDLSRDFQISRQQIYNVINRASW